MRHELGNVKCNFKYNFLYQVTELCNMDVASQQSSSQGSFGAAVSSKLSVNTEHVCFGFSVPRGFCHASAHQQRHNFN